MNDWLTPILGLAGLLLGGWFTYRLGKMQVQQASKAVDVADKTTRETEFWSSLLELIDQQEKKLERQDVKIENLDKIVEAGRTLADDLKRANFNLAIENQRLKRTTDDLEQDVNKLRAEVALLRAAQIH